MTDDATRELAEAVAAHLDEQYQKDARYGTAYVYGDEGRGSPDWDGQVTLDGVVDLYKLVSLFRHGVPRLATELPELSEKGNSEPVLLQWGSTPRIHIACYSMESSGWVSEHDGCICENPQCWWELPRTLTPAALTELEGAPLPVEGVAGDETPIEVECPKCGEMSGNQWSQCQGSCPIPGSPHYSVKEALRRILRPARR